jgi:mRNA-degrading endonuclease RelE of RelBE toxin-antitoxin system
MADACTLELKLPFLAGLLLLRPRDIQQIREQIAALAQDPAPDRKRKRHVKRLNNVFQLSVGDFRIFYAIETLCVTVIAVHRRGDRGYYDFIMGDGPQETDAWRFATRSLLRRLAELCRKELTPGLRLSDVELAELRALRATFPGGLDDDASKT